MSTPLAPGGSAPLPVARAARVLGVHPNTVRAWTEQGRLPCLRINARGDRRYRMEDLERFLSQALRDEGDLGREPEDGPPSAADLPGRVTGPHLRDRQLDETQALIRIAADLNSRLDPAAVAAALLDHGLALFDAEHGAVCRRLPDGSFVAAAIRGLEEDRLLSDGRLAARSLPAQVLFGGRADFASGHAVAEHHPGDGRHGRFDTIAAVPLRDGAEALGVFILGHDRPHPWTGWELDLLEALASQASIAFVNASRYAQATRWAAQLQSIQALGVRLNRLRSVRDIGHAIAFELRQLLDYHNVRVYRVEGRNVIPVAWHGEIGEYRHEAEEQLGLKVGQGITGWVAEHGVAQYLPDAESDPRSLTIPGTTKIDESLLVAPMRFEDRVLGVIVLSKLGLHQFSPDDLRLLEIYASFAAQAVSTATATEQLRQQSASLERQLRSRRELLTITRSILTALDPHVVLEELADRLGSLVAYDNLGIDLHDKVGHRLDPFLARGVHADHYRRQSLPDGEGLAGWVVQHGEPQLVPDERADPRVRHFESTGVVAGALVSVPLHGRNGIVGVLTVERLGETAAFSTEEFELVQLFAAQASIALENAETHQAVEHLAQTDGLTEVANHATFQRQFQDLAARGERFSLLMIDLDDFKTCNDSLGHQAGDRYLRAVAHALGSAGREGDRVYRYGGDEFAVLLRDTGSAGAESVAERVLELIRDVTAHFEPSLDTPITCSIGTASFPQDGATADEVLLAADRGCYFAKRAGGDRIGSSEEGRSLGSEFGIKVPTPVDRPANGARARSPRTSKARPSPDRDGRPGAATPDDGSAPDSGGPEGRPAIGVGPLSGGRAPRAARAATIAR